MSIFVGNLPFRAEREDVLQLFAPHGEVTNCSLPLERDTGRKRGFAFVEMSDEATESAAIDALQGVEMMGRPLRINKAEPRGSSPRRNNSYGNNRGGGYGGGNYGGYGGGNYGGYGGGNSGDYGLNNSAEYNSNRNSGAQGWQDRSYGSNEDENTDYENGRSRRKRGASGDLNSSSEAN